MAHKSGWKSCCCKIYELRFHWWVIFIKRKVKPSKLRVHCWYCFAVSVNISTDNCSPKGSDSSIPKSLQFRDMFPAEWTERCEMIRVILPRELLRRKVSLFSEPCRMGLIMTHSELKRSGWCLSHTSEGQCPLPWWCTAKRSWTRRALEMEMKRGKLEMALRRPVWFFYVKILGP